ncbi:MAG: membrane dipeptidase [Myxococcaceae bacterium]
MAVTGFADLHSHPMAHLGFGGKVLAGKPDAEGADEAARFAKAMERCDVAGQFHRLGGQGAPGGLADRLVGAIVRGATEEHHGACGHPGLHDWPTFHTTAHQQMYVEWIRRAHAGGLRLLCALTVNNELLARCSGAVRYSDFNSVESQMNELRRFVGRHLDFMELASSPSDARRIIEAGRLAVVAGIEVDSIESLARHGPNDEPTDHTLQPSLPTRDLNQNAFTLAEVATVLDRLQSLGISMLTPMHLADNSLGGSAVYSDVFNVLNRFLRGRYFDVREDASVRFRLNKDGRVALLRGLLGFEPPPAYGNSSWLKGHANTRGLTACGQAFLRAAMRRGFIVDIDHMSDRSANEAIALAQGLDYPVISSHSLFRAQGLSETETKVVGKWAHEGQRTLDQARAILALGGLVAPITNQHEVRTYAGTLPNGVANDCARSSKTWAQSYLQALELLEEVGCGGVAIGTDFNGLNEQPGPRFGDRAASGLGEPNKPEENREGEYWRQRTAQQGTELAYPATMAGVVPQSPLPRLEAPLRRPFDLNTDGLANYGMLPDFFADLLQVGLLPAQLDPLFRSAEAFLVMWKRCEDRAPLLPP